MNSLQFFLIKNQYYLYLIYSVLSNLIVVQLIDPMYNIIYYIGVVLTLTLSFFYYQYNQAFPNKSSYLMVLFLTTTLTVSTFSSIILFYYDSISDGFLLLLSYLIPHIFFCYILYNTELYKGSIYETKDGIDKYNNNNGDIDVNNLLERDDVNYKSENSSNFDVIDN